MLRRAEELNTGVKYFTIHALSQTGWNCVQTSFIWLNCSAIWQEEFCLLWKETSWLLTHTHIFCPSFFPALPLCQVGIDLGNTMRRHTGNAIPANLSTAYGNFFLLPSNRQGQPDEPCNSQFGQSLILIDTSLKSVAETSGWQEFPQLKTAELYLLLTSKVGWY